MYIDDVCVHGKFTFKMVAESNLRMLCILIAPISASRNDEISVCRMNPRIGFPSYCCSKSAVFIHRLKSTVATSREKVLSFVRAKSCRKTDIEHPSKLISKSLVAKKTRFFVTEPFFSSFHRALPDFSWRPE